MSRKTNSGDESDQKLPATPRSIEEWRRSLQIRPSSLPIVALPSSSSTRQFKNYIQLRKLQNIEYANDQLEQGNEFRVKGDKQRADNCYQKGLQLVPHHDGLLQARRELIEAPTRSFQTKTTATLRPTAAILDVQLEATLQQEHSRAYSDDDDDDEEEEDDADRLRRRKRRYKKKHKKRKKHHKKSSSRKRRCRSKYDDDESDRSHNEADSLSSSDRSSGRRSRKARRRRRRSCSRSPG